MQPVEYYQIGGFRAHVRDNSTEALASRLMARDERDAEFVLGIRPNGASYLLLPRERFPTQRLGRAPRDRPWAAYEFESLSPAQFPTRMDLAAKLSALVSNKKATDGVPRDRSKANTAYSAGGEGLSPAGIARASFEHQRVFYRLCQNTIDRTVDYALRTAPWFQDVRIFSFTFNTWAADSRALDEREAEPKILDVGWTEFNSPTDSDDLVALSTSHYIIEEDRYLSNPGRKKLSLPDITQYMPRGAVETLLQDLFAPVREGERRPPKLLLVHDERMTRSVLRSLKVDTSQWKDGIKDLLYFPDPRGTPTLPPHRDSKGDVRDRSKKWSHSRSRSPRRHIGAEYTSRPRSPPASFTPPPVYIVDVRQMYQTMMEVPPRDDSVAKIATALRVRDTAPVRGEGDCIIYEDVDPTSWCAGRESRLIGYVWEDMANSIAIDEQRALRLKFSKEDPIYDAAEAGGEDEDLDPNDIMQPSYAQGSSRAHAPRPVGMFDSESEDEDW